MKLIILICYLIVSLESKSEQNTLEKKINELKELDELINVSFLNVNAETAHRYYLELAYFRQCPFLEFMCDDQSDFLIEMKTVISNFIIAAKNGIDLEEEKLIVTRKEGKELNHLESLLHQGIGFCQKVKCFYYVVQTTECNVKEYSNQVLNCYKDLQSTVEKDQSISPYVRKVGSSLLIALQPNSK